MSEVPFWESSDPATPADGSWHFSAAKKIYNLPFNDLLFQAHTVFRAQFDPNSVQLSRLLSIKTGGCPEDCGYCSQSAYHPTGL